MKKWICIILLGGMFLLGMSFRVNAQTETTTLELTVRQVVVEEGVASITGPAAGSKVELYDNLEEGLIASGTSDANGIVAFSLDDRYPLSGKGVFHTVVKVNGVSNGEFTCQQGQTCQEALFTIDGLRPDLNDGVLIVRVVRSSNLDEPVAGIQLYAWPMDPNGTALKLPIVGFGGQFVYDWSGVVCITNEEGYCAVDIHGYFKWAEDVNNRLVSLVVLKIGTIFTYDGASIAIPEGGYNRVSIAVNDKGKLDDCVFKVAPTDKVLNPSCMDKLHQTATAQATITINPADFAVNNNAVVQASILSKETADLFAAHTTDQEKVTQYLKWMQSIVFNPSTQVKIILYVDNITNDGYNAQIGEYVIGKTIEITTPDNPDNLLGACQVNDLGECISVVDRAGLLAPDGLLKFHVLADGYDNGILICQNESICEQHAYTVTGLKDYQDAVILFKFVRDGKLIEPVKGVRILAGIAVTLQQWRNYEWYGYRDAILGYRSCTSDANGACPIYVDDKEFFWKEENGEYYADGMIRIGNSLENDLNNIRPKDDRLVVIYLAVNKANNLVDCTFTSPLTYEEESKVCYSKKIALQTAIAGYTATPSVTITPLPSATPTMTEIPPTSTITLTPNPTPQERMSTTTGNSTAIYIAGGSVALLLIAALGVYFWKRKSR